MTLRISSFLLALCLPLAAQEKTTPKPAAGVVQVRLLAEQAPAELGKVFLVFDKTQSAAIDLPVNQLSDPIAAPSRVMVLKTLDKEISLCQITLPELGKSFAVVLVVAKPAGYTPIIVRTDDPTFLAGDVFFINRSEKVVLGKLGKTPLSLNPGQTAKSHPTGPVEDTYYDIAFASREPSGDKLISSSRWPIDKLLRSYVFFFTNAQGRTTFRAVDEYLTPPAKPAP